MAGKNSWQRPNLRSAAFMPLHLSKANRALKRAEARTPKGNSDAAKYSDI
jgi:hypothetical protein